MTPRNRYLGKQLRRALRASRWSADIIAFRASVGRSVMARALVGDTALSLHTYELVAEQLELNLEFAYWRAAGQPPACGGAVATAVDRAQGRLKAGSLTDLAGILTPAAGFSSVRVEDMRR